MSLPFDQGPPLRGRVRIVSIPADVLEEHLGAIAAHEASQNKRTGVRLQRSVDKLRALLRPVSVQEAADRFLADTRAHNRAVVAELTALSQELGLYDDALPSAPPTPA